MEKAIFLALFFFLFSAVSHAAENNESVPCPDRKVGQEFQYERKDLITGSTSNLTNKIIQIEGGAITTLSGGSESKRDIMFNRHSTSGGVYLNLPRCPFKLGEMQKNKTSYRHSSGADVNNSQELKVGEIWENITTPAGTFKAVKISIKDSLQWTSGSASGGGFVNQENFYAPSIGALIILNSNSVPSSGSRVHFSSTLVGFKD